MRRIPRAITAPSSRTAPNCSCNRPLHLLPTSGRLLSLQHHPTSRPPLPSSRRLSSKLALKTASPVSTPTSASSIRTSASSHPDDDLGVQLDGEGDGEEGATSAPTFKLRPYQEDCVNACLEALQRGLSRIAVSAPTGSGKTAMFTSLIKMLPPISHHHGLATRVLIIVGSIELATQAAFSVETIWPDLTVEIEQSLNKASGEADVTIATYQTLAYNDYARLQKFDPTTFKAVIVDEAHHAAARTYLGILSYFDSRVGSVVAEASMSETVPMEPSPILPANSPVASSSVFSLDEAPPIPAVFDDFGSACVPILGFSATLARADGLSLGKVFEEVVWYGDWLDFIRGKWLAPLRFTTVSLGDALDINSVAVSSKTGDFVTTSLALAVKKDEVVSLIVDAWFKKAAHRTSTLVFGVNVEHVVKITNEFRSQGVNAQFIYEGTPPKERQVTLAAFKRGEIPVLVNCAILTEGADFPSIDCVLLARPTKSSGLYTQMIGRGLRLSAETGKVDCLILDIVGNSTRGVLNAPTLFGLDPDSIIEDQSTESLLTTTRAQEESEEERPPSVWDRAQVDLSNHDVEYRDFATVFDLLRVADKETSRPNFISYLTRNSWVGCGNDIFVLELGNRKLIKITSREEENGQVLYDAHRHQTFSASDRFYSAPPAHIGTHHDFRTLLRLADASLKAYAGQLTFDLRRDANWRQGPSSESQKESIRIKLLKTPEQREADTISGVWIGRPFGEAVPIESLTRGNAADTLTRLFNGALPSYRKAEKKREREEAKKVRAAGVAEKSTGPGAHFGSIRERRWSPSGIIQI